MDDPFNSPRLQSIGQSDGELNYNEMLTYTARAPADDHFQEGQDIL
jgi:hypothetical protein